MCRFLAVLVVCSSVFLGGATSWAGEQGKGSKNKAAKHAQKAKVKEDRPDRSDRPDQHGAGSQMRFHGLDMNNDGRISRAEWRGNDVSFGNHDWNRDGVLSGDEVRPGATRPAHPERPASHVRFDSLDLNNNGVIVPAEWRADHRIFDRLDTNDDGRVTPAEFARWQ